MTKINISNLKCGGCVANAKKALADVPGLDSVEISLEQSTAVLGGDFSLEDALKRLADAGYPSEKSA